MSDEELNYKEMREKPTFVTDSEVIRLLDELDSLKEQEEVFLAEHDENVKLHFENIDLKDILSIAEKVIDAARVVASQGQGFEQLENTLDAYDEFRNKI